MNQFLFWVVSIRLFMGFACILIVIQIYFLDFFLILDLVDFFLDLIEAFYEFIQKSRVLCLSFFKLLLK